MVQRQELLAYLNDFLSISRYRDYAPNGLQVEGKPKIHRLVTGVTACQALIDRAVELKADALLVHHGYFWRGEDPCLVGMKRNRIGTLLEHNISLFAYHLPLDGHPELGNNAQLAEVLGLSVDSGLDPTDDTVVGNVGRLQAPVSAPEFADAVSAAMARDVILVSGGKHLIQRVAWCTGGAQGYIEKAVAQGVDAFISGEISEQTTHIAREQGIHYIAAGHHATERYGAAALGRHLAHKFDIFHEFVNIDNPA